MAWDLLRPPLLMHLLSLFIWDLNLPFLDRLWIYILVLVCLISQLERFIRNSPESSTQQQTHVINSQIRLVKISILLII